MMTEKLRIEQAVVKFRSVLEISNIKESYDNLRNFPHGACGDASNLIGYFLTSNGFGDFEYVWGEKNIFSLSTHAWVESDRFLIDITADQFDATNKKCIIIEKTKPITNHLGFEVVSRSKCELMYLFSTYSKMQNFL
jgi:hypothetical protein